MKSRETYKRFAQYYDLYVGDFDADLPLYHSLCHSAQYVLEIGCGTGRVLHALLQTGKCVTGIDVSDAMLEVASTNLSEYLKSGVLQLKKHDLREAPLPERYDRVLVTFYTFNYLLADSDQKKFLVNMHKSLTPYGVLVMDLFYPQPLARPDSANQWQESVLESDGRRVVLKQKRKMVGYIEERIQIYTEGADQEEIFTRRRYVSKQGNQHFAEPDRLPGCPRHTKVMINQDFTLCGTKKSHIQRSSAQR